MYASSAEYKAAISAVARECRVTGVLTLADNSTVALTDEDVVANSLVLSEQCISGDGFEVGNVYAAELCVGLVTPTSAPWSLDGAKLALSFGILTGYTEDEIPVAIWEDIPLGVFWVTEIERKDGYSLVHALDGMILLDVDLGATVVAAQTVEQLVTNACTTAGVTLATTHITFETFPNKAMVLTLPSGTEARTCRDLVMWCCMLNGKFARMNRAGQLEILPLHSASARTITKTERFATTKVSDFTVKITGIQTQVVDVPYQSGTSVSVMTLLGNPLLTSKEPSAITTALAALLAEVTQAEYTPFDISFIGDPTIMPGDYITLSDTGGLGSSPVGLVTNSTWHFRGKHELISAGKPGIVKVDPSTTQIEKKVQSLVGVKLTNATSLGTVDCTTPSMTVTADSHIAQCVASRAFDNNSSTDWFSDGGGQYHWIAIDLGTPKRIGGLKFWASSANNFAMYFQYSDDNTNWTTIDTIACEDGQYPPPVSVTFTNPPSSAHRYYRCYDATSQPFRARGFFEIELYEFTPGLVKLPSGKYVGSILGPDSSVSGNFLAFDGTSGDKAADSGASAASFAVAAHAHVEADLNLTDLTTKDASTSAHGFAPKLVAPAAGMRNVLGIDNAETALTNKALFDAANPSTQAFSDTANPGTAMVAARRDHKHAMPASPGGGASVDDSAYGSGWDGDTTHAPSRNAVYDKIETISTGGGGLTEDDVFLFLRRVRRI